MISLILLKLFTFSQILQGVPKLSHATVCGNGALELFLTQTWDVTQNRADDLIHSVSPWSAIFLCTVSSAHDSLLLHTYSGYGKYSDPLKFFTLCYIAAIC